MPSGEYLPWVVESMETRAGTVTHIEPWICIETLVGKLPAADCLTTEARILP